MVVDNKAENDWERIKNIPWKICVGLKVRILLQDALVPIYRGNLLIVVIGFAA